VKTIVRGSLLTAALLGTAAPAALTAQGFTLAVQGKTQGLFPGTKEGAIPALRLSYGVKSPRDLASGLATGKRQHGPVVVTKLVGISSPQLFQALTTNEVLSSVVINCFPAGGGSPYIIKLTDASASEIKQYTEMENSAPVLLEDVSFTFRKIEVQDPNTKSLAMDDLGIMK
jgi:type VI secretion system secreted protein Hcp